MPDPGSADDRLEIADAIERYFAALDEKDYARLDTVFAPGATLVYDLGTPARVTYPEMADVFRRFNARFRLTQHLASPPLVDLDGDHARATCRLRAVHVQEALDGSTHTWVIYGRYHDRLERRAEGWRIVEREFRALHQEGELLPEDRVRAHAAPLG